MLSSSHFFNLKNTTNAKLWQTILFSDSFYIQFFVFHTISYIFNMFVFDSGRAQSDFELLHLWLMSTKCSSLIEQEHAILTSAHWLIVRAHWLLYRNTKEKTNYKYFSTAKYCRAWIQILRGINLIHGLINALRYILPNTQSFASRPQKSLTPRNLL